MIRLLDCTLRDGAYVVDGKFGKSAICGIIDKMCDAGIDIVECGWLKNAEHEVGTTFYHTPNDLLRYISEKRPNVTYVVMIDWDRYDVDSLPVNDGKSVDAIRIVFPYGKYREGIEVGRRILEKGYKVFFQAANTLNYSDEELIALADEVNTVHAECLSIVDTYGAMDEEELERIFNTLDKHLEREIHLGFHSHNNQQLSFALSIQFVKEAQNRNRAAVVDSSLCGMGRGAGNTTTELMVSFLNRKCKSHYNLDAIMDAIDIYMGYFKENYQWGYSTPYFIAGLYCCHVNNIAYLLNDNHRTNAKDMRIIIESMTEDERKKYDYDLLEQKYVNIQSRYVDDAKAMQYLADELKDRDILLIAPGKTSLENQEKIKDYIKNNMPVVIGINALISGYQYDFVLFVNSARYEYAQSVCGTSFYDFRHIVLSNIKTEAEKGEYIINFNEVIKRGWEHFDNAAICCLRLMDRLGISRLSIAGFDGFKDKYNESYADPRLPSLNPKGKWQELNMEIKQIYDDFKQNAKACKKINFLTESIFE